MTSVRLPDHDEYYRGWPPGVTPPPRGIDLPYDDGEPMETPTHRHQMDFLIELFIVLLDEVGRRDVFVGGNHAVYYSALQAKKNDFKSPDVFVVLDAIDNPDRRSWVVWEEEGRVPNVVIELLSDTTESNDRGPKKRVYERVLRVPDYYLFDPIDGRFEGFRLAGGRYEPLAKDAHGRLRCEELDLYLGPWHGPYLNMAPRTWLRLYRPDGSLVPTQAEAAEERARAATARADAETARADAETARADAAEAELRALRAELAAHRG